MTHEIDDNVTADEARYISLKLTEYADRFTGPRNFREFSFVMRSEAGEVVGGIRVNTVWDWLQVDSLWVADELRGQGYGGRLLARAEAKARELGCKHARLNTFEFEARAFYEKHGYVVEFEMKDFPTGHSQFRLTKDF